MPPSTIAPVDDIAALGLSGAIPRQRRARHTLRANPGPPPTPIRRPGAAVEATRPLRTVERTGGLKPIALPFPERSGLLIRHPQTGALAVSCDRPSTDSPDAERFPCYAVIAGHAQHGGHLWLTYREARMGGWRLAGDVRDLL